MYTIFFSDKEKENIRNWKYSVNDKSISTTIFTPLWNWLATLIPDNVAPNILSLTGLLCILYSFNLAYNYIEEYPKIISLLVCILTFAYMNLDAIDGKHARNIKNATPLGELFDHSCDNIGVIFMILPLTYILGVKDLYVQWYIVQIGQLVFLWSHLEAFKKRIVEFGRFTGPGEFLIIYLGISFARLFFNFNLGSYMTMNLI